MIGMAERVEVVIDFSQFSHPQFTELYIENRLLQDDGRGPNGKFEKPELAARGTQILKFMLEETVPDPSRVPPFCGLSLPIHARGTRRRHRSGLSGSVAPTASGPSMASWPVT